MRDEDDMARRIRAAYGDPDTPKEDKRELALAYVLWVEYGVTYGEVQAGMRLLRACVESEARLKAERKKTRIMDGEMAAREEAAMTPGSEATQKDTDKEEREDNSCGK